MSGLMVISQPTASPRQAVVAPQSKVERNEMPTTANRAPTFAETNSARATLKQPDRPEANRTEHSPEQQPSPTTAQSPSGAEPERPEQSEPQMALADEAVLVAWLAQLEQALADPNGQAGLEEALSQLVQRLAQQQQAGQLSPAVLQDVQRLVGDLLAAAGQPIAAQLQGLRQQLMALAPTQPASVSLASQQPPSLAPLSATDFYQGFSQLAERVEGGAGLARLEGLKTLTELVNLRQLQALHQPGLTGLGEFSPLPSAGQSMAIHGAAQPHQFAPISLDHSTSIANQLCGPLSDRLRVQTQLGVQQANLRLDPPELGKLDLQVRTEGDRVYVLIQAANPTVREQLLQLTDRLRQDLMTDTFSQVEVDVGSFDDSQNGKQQRQENFQAEETVLAAQADRQGAATRQRQQGWDFYV